MKKLLSVALAVTMLVGLTACGDVDQGAAKGNVGAVTEKVLDAAESLKDAVSKESESNEDADKNDGVESPDKKDEGEISSGTIEGMQESNGDEGEEPTGEPEYSSSLIELINNPNVDLNEALGGMSEEDIQLIVQDILTNPEKYADIGVNEETIEALNGLLQQLQDVSQDTGSKKQPRSGE